MNTRKLKFSKPHSTGCERAALAKQQRDLATEISMLQPQALTQANGEESDHGPKYPANFTKGLAHDENGLLEKPEDYQLFVEAINSPDRTLFDTHVQSAKDQNKVFTSTINNTTPEWRGWESPRAGLAYELEGPDPGALAMAPAPRVGSSELAAEMAEVYALATLRDVPFTEIASGGNSKLCAEGGTSQLTSTEIVSLLAGMPFYDGNNVSSSTPLQVDQSGLNAFERNRRLARTGTLTGGLTLDNVFRGSTTGAQTGPYISQFLLAGVNSLDGGTGGTPGFPGLQANFDAEDGFITYGAQIIDQRILTHKNCLDYMTDWTSWLDVQNGANIKNANQFEAKRRFITTPRDLATYVHFDALYQAYLNACLILLDIDTPTSRGFPEQSLSGRRTAFATFGGPHILTLVTEVATRCLKAVRRQKFNYHRRGRPEAMGGRLTLVCAGLKDELGCASAAFEKMFNEIPVELREAIIQHNAEQNNTDMTTIRRVKSVSGCASSPATGNCNLLLPMAFPEGSPMHPAYGAGHATVAGGCVTMLKAFFEMYEDCDSGILRTLKLGDKDYFVPNNDGSKLQNIIGTPLTIQGELDKLTANISIARNMAGVHYYSDYYDSLRMGERVAVGILLEQCPAYGDEVEMTFDSFDGDRINIYGEAGSCPSISIMDKQGIAVSPRDWWLRHTLGQEFSQGY
ncbi:MAG: bromoperoxidase [Methyloprofundus sp.]|nr:bromoperoxidase [Methyloprofundus sp.]